MSEGGGGATPLKLEKLGDKAEEREVAEDSTSFKNKNSFSSIAKNGNNLQEGKTNKRGGRAVMASQNKPIPSSMTPTKRKLYLENNTSNLVKIFTSLTEAGPGESESPSKKLKLRNGLKVHHYLRSQD